MSTNASAMTGSQDPSDLRMACVYALSGAYGTLPRFLYYATLVLAIFGRNQEWLVIGALVSSLAYAGTTAIHVMALCSSKEGVFDLDALGAWAVLSTAALSYVALIHWSSTIRNSNARIVMVAWGMLIGAALIFNRIIIYDQPFEDFEEPCYSSDGMLLTSPSELIKPEFHCSYTCFNISKPMRGRSEILAVPVTDIDNKFSNLSYILVGPIMFAAYVAISWDSQQHAPPRACTWYVMRKIKVGHREDLMKLIFDASNETWYGGYFAMLHFMWQMPWNGRKLLLGLVGCPWLMLGFLMDVLCLPFLIINIVINELRLLRSGLPFGEAMYNVGQWSPVVNSILIVIAAIISKVLEVMEARKKGREKQQQQQQQRQQQPQPDFDLRRIDTDATLIEELHIGSDERHGSLTEYPTDVYFGEFSNRGYGRYRLV